MAVPSLVVAAWLIGVGLENAVTTGACLTHDIAVVEGQVVLLEDLDEIPVPEAVSAASTDAPCTVPAAARMACSEGAGAHASQIQVPNERQPRRDA